MAGREASLDTELDERKFRNNLSQLIGDFRRIFSEYHPLCRGKSFSVRQKRSTQRNVSFGNYCLQADKENLIFSSPHYQLSNKLSTFLKTVSEYCLSHLGFRLLGFRFSGLNLDLGLGTQACKLYFFNRNLNH